MHRNPATHPTGKKTGEVQSQRVMGKVAIRVPQPQKVNRAPLRRHLRIHHHLQAHQLRHQPQLLRLPLRLRQAHNGHQTYGGQSPKGSASR